MVMYQYDMAPLCLNLLRRLRTKQHLDDPLRGLAIAERVCCLCHLLILNVVIQESFGFCKYLHLGQALLLEYPPNLSG